MACVRLEYESKIIKSSPQASFLKLTMLFIFEKIKKKAKSSPTTVNLCIKSWLVCAIYLISAVASGREGGEARGALAPPKKFLPSSKSFFCCYPGILTGKTPNFMLIIFFSMRNVVFLVIKATL